MRSFARITLLALGLGILPVAAQDAEEDGGGFLENLIEDRLSSEGFQVRVRGFEGALSSRASIASIEISDAEGTWLTINDAVLDWNRSALLRGRLEVEELAAGEILLPRLPQGEEQMDVPSPEATPFSLPDLPVSIQIDSIDAERIELGQPVIGEAAVMTLSGSANLANGEGAVDITAERIDGEEGVFAIAGSYENSDRRLTLDVSLEEGEDGIVANLIDLPGRPALSLGVEGDGPLSDFVAEIALATNGEPRLEGTVELIEEDGGQGFAVDIGGDVTALFAPTYRPFFGENVQLSAEGALQSDGAFALSQLDLTARALSLQGQVTVGADGVPDLIDVTGAIASDEGPVLLPVGGEIRVAGVQLAVQFDASQGEGWGANIVVEGLEQPGFEADRVTLEGRGIISGSGDDLAVTAGLDLGATGLTFDDGGLTDAVGDGISGRVDIDYAAGQPVQFEMVRLDGAGFNLNGAGSIDPAGENLPLTFDGQLDADDLSVFSGLAGRPLDGGASLDAQIEAQLLSGGFDVSLDGRTQNLAVGIAQLDPLLTGGTVLAVEAQRDEAGLRIRELSVENPALDLDATADLTSDGGTANASLNVGDLSLVDPALEGPGLVRLSANRPEDVWTLELEAEGGDAQVTGEVLLSELDEEDTSPLADFDLVARAADLSNFSAVAGRDLGGSFDITTNGSARFDLTTIDAEVEGIATDLRVGQEEADALLDGMTQIDIALMRDGSQIDLPRFRIENPQITATAEAQVATGDSTVDARIALTDLSRIVAEMQGPATLVLDATEDEQGWTVDLDGEGAEASIVADVLVTGLRDADVVPRVDGAAQIAARDLSLFSDIADRELAGSVDLSVDIDMTTDFETVDATVDGTTRNVRIGQAEVDRLMRGLTELSVAADKQGERIIVEALNLENPQITIDAEGRYGVEDAAVQANVTLPDLAEIVPAMSGDATLVLDAEEGAEGWVIDLDAEGAEARIVADMIVAGLGEEGAIPRVDGTAEIAARDLSLFSDLANRQLGGSVDLAVDLDMTTDLETVDATVEGTTRDVRIGQAEADRLLRGLTRVSIDAEKEGERFRLGALDIENPQISVNGDGQYGMDDAAIQANVVLPDLGEVVPELSGRGEVTLFAEEVGSAWQVSLDGDGAGAMIDLLGEVRDLQSTPTFDGRIEAQAGNLSRFSRIANRSLSGSVDVDASGEVRLDFSRFDVTADVRGNGLRVGIAQVDQLLAGGATSLDVSAVRNGASAPIRVRTLRLDSPGLDATASGSVLGGSSDLTFNARLANLGQFVPGLDGPLTAEGRAGQRGSQIALNVALTGPQNITARINGTVAESFDRASLDIDGAAPLRLANPFIEPRAATGTAQFDLSLNGPLAVQSLSGTVTVADARVVDPGLPAVLENVQGTVRLQGAQAILNVTANKQAGGQIRVSGPISLQPGYSANLEIQLANLVFEDPRLYRTTIDGTLGVNGALTGGAAISGALRLGETELRIPSTGLGATGPIPDGLVHVNEPADVRRTRARADLLETDDGASGGASGGGGGFPLDIRIVAENQIFVRGRGLDAELGGQLILRGTTANIVPSGRFELIRGRIDILGQRITMSEGSVTLQGDFDPIIRLVAETESEDVIVRIVVEGRATSPEIAFRSEPELPEDEVLSRLLFGRSIEDISPLQAAQLASAVATLAGRGGDGIVANLRQSTGLDDLDVTTDSEGNVGLQAGKYISENVYTSVNVDSEGEAEVNINLDLTQSITVRGSANNTGETSLGVFFERDY